MPRLTQKEFIERNLRTERGCDVCVHCGESFDTATVDYELLVRVDRGDPCGVGSCPEKKAD